MYVERIKNPVLEAAHGHSSRHRDSLFQSEICGCFHCGTTFQATEISRWTNEVGAEAVTALCPHCAIDAVIGSKSGFPITSKFLSEMREYWFRSCDDEEKDDG